MQRKGLCVPGVLLLLKHLSQPCSWAEEVGEYCRPNFLVTSSADLGLREQGSGLAVALSIGSSELSSGLSEFTHRGNPQSSLPVIDTLFC